MSKKSQTFFETLDGEDISSGFDFNEEVKKLRSSLDRLKSMSVQEFTFYKKWEETQQFRGSNIFSNADRVENKIWKINDPTDEEGTINQIEQLSPEVIFVKDGDVNHYESWGTLRMFCHTMEYNQNPGRFLRFIVVDKTSNKYLGVISVASDVIAITDRDSYLGWNTHNRLKDKKLANSAIGSCIMATQPFGYNFLGGKLIASLVTSKVVRDTWKELYGQTLVGMTTTSLYGSYSMYNNIPVWHKCGTSSGKILIKPDQSCYDTWHKWIKENRSEEYIKTMTQKEGVAGPVTAAKLRILSMIMDSCELKQKHYVHGYERGVYYSCFYQNTKEYLQNKITDEELKIKHLISGDVNSIMEWWRPKAINRFKKLFSENNVKKDHLFYLPMVNMTYEEAKEKYFADVGVGK